MKMMMLTADIEISIADTDAAPADVASKVEEMLNLHARGPFPVEISGYLHRCYLRYRVMDTE